MASHGERKNDERPSTSTASLKPKEKRESPKPEKDSTTTVLKATARIRALEHAVDDLQHLIFNLDQNFDDPPRPPDELHHFTARMHITNADKKTTSYKCKVYCETKFDALYVEYVRGTKHLDAISVQFDTDGEAKSFAIPKRQHLYPQVIAELITSKDVYLRVSMVMMVPT
jgi:hypothetical protein